MNKNKTDSSNSGKVATASLLEQVSILSTLTLPSPLKIPVMVHYRTTEGLFSKVVMASQALRFDELVCSTLQRMVDPRPSPKIEVDGTVDAARLVYHRTRAFALKSIITPAKFDAPILDTRSVEPNNIAHLLINLLPYCLHAQEFVDPETVMIFGKMWPNFKRLAQLLNVEANCELRRIKGNIIQISGTRGLAVYPLIEIEEVCPIALLPNIYKKFEFPELVKREKIFLARRGARAISNHEAAQELTERFGYTTIFMEDYSLEEQMSIGANAKHVVAVHGAAISFLVFARRIENLIELMPNHNYIEYFPVALGSIVIRYEQIISFFDITEGHRGWGSLSHHKSMPFTVDLQLLSQRLTLIS